MTPSGFTINKFRSSIVITLYAISVLLTGCGADNVSQPEDFAAAASVEEDVAVSVAGAVAEETGGVMEEVGDIAKITACSDFEELEDAFESESDTVVYMNYDESEGLWTITFSGTWGDAGSYPYAHIERVYTLQYLSESGQPQKYWVVDSDTASTINFTIREGDGQLQTWYLSHELNELEAGFMVAGANTDVITINGSYHRSGDDVITTRGAVRTAAHILDFQLIDITVPLDDPTQLSDQASGTITGTYQAEITFESDQLYSERNIYKDIQIVLGDGDADISVENRVFTADIHTGEIEGLF